MPLEKLSFVTLVVPLIALTIIPSGLLLSAWTELVLSFRPSTWLSISFECSPTYPPTWFSSLKPREVLDYARTNPE